MISPSAGGWDTPSLQAEAEGEWSGFTHELAAMVGKGCFPAGESSFSVQRQIVEAIPVPADRVLRYYYSLTASGFVDLQPGMQLGIETLNAAAPGTSHTERLSVVDRPPAGVGLELISAGKHERTEDSVLPQIFSAMPFLRLFLQRSATGEEGAREAMLLGASSSAGLDGATTVILKEGEHGCAGELVGGKCLVFAGKGVSLLTAISVNGRPAFYAPGTTLSQVVDVIPETRRARAFATLTVERRSAGGLVPIETPRTDEARFNLLLLNGDRIRWRQ